MSGQLPIWGPRCPTPNVVRACNALHPVTVPSPRRGEPVSRVQLTLPLPPSKNELVKRPRYGRAYPTEKKAKYQDAVRLAFARYRPLEGPVRVQLLVYRGLRNGKLRRGDLQNYEEVLFDALQGIAYLNDSQVKRIESELFDDRERPRVDVTVEQYRRE